MKRCKHSIEKFLFSFIIVFFAAFIGESFTSVGVMSEWYKSVKPGIAPPDHVFPVVWTILYVLIALSLYFAWTKESHLSGSSLLKLFGANLILNASWSIFFFGLKNPLASLVTLIVLWVSIISLIILTYRINKTSSYLLIPYLLWVSFAGILNLIVLGNLS